MRANPIAAALCTLLLTVFAAAQTDRFARDEVLVKFSQDSLAARAEARIRDDGARSVERLGDLGWQRVKIPAGSTVEETVAKYERMAGVAAVQPNFYYRLLATPNDAQFSAANMYGLFKISAPQAWDITTGSPTVVVANIDTGIRYTHEDLAANMWTNPGETPGNSIDDDGNGFIDDVYGYDFFFNDANPADENGHGTHTAGTIGAVGNNGIGVVGVAWNVRVMAIKIYDSDGFGTTSAMLINAYNYVRMMKNRGVNIRVTNNSYGGCDEACGYDQATKDAIDALGDTGILNVFAAGNDGRNTDNLPAYPASYTSPSIISVANSTSTDARNGSSNFGVVTVDLAAPGTQILSTVSNTNASYAAFTGTSMAAPHVAGAAALLAAQNPNISPQAIKARLLNSVDLLASWNGVVRTGGRLNANLALQNTSACGLDTAAPAVNVGTKGGYFTLNVAGGQNCDYSVKSEANWIAVEGARDRTGAGTVRFRVATATVFSRTGKLKVAGQTVTINQTRGLNL